MDEYKQCNRIHIYAKRVNDVCDYEIVRCGMIDKFKYIYNSKRCNMTDSHTNSMK